MRRQPHPPGILRAVQKLKQSWESASSGDLQSAINKLVSRGCSKRYLARELGIPEATLRYYANRPGTNHTQRRMQPGGRTPALKGREPVSQTRGPGHAPQDSNAAAAKLQSAGPRKTSAPRSAPKAAPNAEPAAATKLPCPPPADPVLVAIEELSGNVVTILVDFLRSQTNTLGPGMRAARLQKIFYEARNYKGSAVASWREQPPAQVSRGLLWNLTRPKPIPYDSPGPSPVFVAEWIVNILAALVPDRSRWPGILDQVQLHC